MECRRKAGPLSAPWMIAVALSCLASPLRAQSPTPAPATRVQPAHPLQDEALAQSMEDARRAVSRHLFDRATAILERALPVAAGRPEVDAKGLLAAQLMLAIASFRAGDK